MQTNLDETELARLEALAKHVLLPFETVIEYGVGCPSGNGPVPLQVCMTRNKHDARYIAAACNAVPALVAEVRRLREALNKEHRAWQCAEGRGDGLEMENAALREKVEAWEWWEEVRRYSLFDAHPYCEWSDLPLREKVFKCAKAEYWRIFDAAWMAVHADRE